MIGLAISLLAGCYTGEREEIRIGVEYEGKWSAEITTGDVTENVTGQYKKVWKFWDRPYQTYGIKAQKNGEDTGILEVEINRVIINYGWYIDDDIEKENLAKDTADINDTEAEAFAEL
jgi:hypothetical protein